MRSRKLYDTSDPEKLLLLKRQESVALLEVIRSINVAQINLTRIFKIAKNTLLAQLGVRRMSFIFKKDDVYFTEMQHRIADPTDEILEELPITPGIMKVDPVDYPYLTEEGVEYVIPFLYGDGIGAWILIAEFAESEEEKRNDLIFIETLGNVLVVALENAEFLSNKVKQEALRRELEVAENIQKQLLPTDHSQIRSADIYAINVSHDRVGGDFYDVMSWGGKGFFVCIADVSGKGIAAALLMANILSNLRSLILSEDHLESLIMKLNRNVFQVTQGEKFVTLFLAHIRANDGEMDYINAGHNDPILVRSGTGEVESLSTGSTILGAFEELPFASQATLKYSPGDLMFLYTDGLVEQTNQKEELLGEEEVIHALQQCEGLSAHKVVDQMNQLYANHANGMTAEDDITMMAVRFK